jgi:hypothetical protein
MISTEQEQEIASAKPGLKNPGVFIVGKRHCE